MRSGPLANTYVQALCGVDRKGMKLEYLSREISTLAQLYESSPELRSILENPGFRPEERRRILDLILAKLQVSKIGGDFLFLLVDKGRTRLLPEIAFGLEQRADRAEGVVPAQIITANPLKKKQVERLSEVLRQVRGGPVKLVTQVDPDLIGGVIIRMDGRIYDGSVKTHLATIREMFLKEG